MSEALSLLVAVLHFIVIGHLLLSSRYGSSERMRLLKAFTAFSLFHEILIWSTLLLIGQRTGLYFHVYYLGCLVHFGFMTALIVDIHRGCRLRWTWRSSGMLAVFVGVFLGHFLFTKQVSASLYLLAVILLLHVQTFLCAALNLALAYSSGVKLGRVRGAVLWAVTAATMLSYVVYVTPAFDLVPYAVMRHLIPWASLIFWLLLLYGLRFRPEEAFQTTHPETRAT